MSDISVIIPTYNRSDYLKQAIASCFAGNEDIDVEVVVVDDGSTDGTREYLRDLDNPNVRSIFQEHQGGQVARNHGLKEAQGTYIKFLDDDDWLAEGGLATEVSMIGEAGADISFGGYTVVGDSQKHRESVAASQVDDFIAGLLDGRIRTLLFRFTYSSRLTRTLCWNEELPCRQDVDFVFQAALYEPEVVRVPKKVAFYRQHDKPRVSSTAANVTEPARVHAELLIHLVEAIEMKKMWTPERRQSAARGLWTWAHLMAGVDLSLFREMYSWIQYIQPGFQPNRDHQVLTLLDRWGGVRTTEYLLYPLRKIKGIL